MRKSTRARPSAPCWIFSMRARRSAMIPVITPTKSTGTSMVSCSNGSSTPFGPLCRSTSGRETSSSNPSRRICSTRMASWSSPRPRTWKASPVSVGLTSIAGLPSTSFSRRAFSWREVRNLPSLPPIGLVLTPNVICSVGGSTWSRSSGRGSAGSVIVSPISTSASPAIPTISPGPASATSTRSMPIGSVSDVTVPLIELSSRMMMIFAPLRMIPLRMRPTAMRPTKSFAARFVISTCNGWPGSCIGAGAVSSTTSKSGIKSVPGFSRSSVAVPARALV